MKIRLVCLFNKPISNVTIQTSPSKDPDLNVTDELYCSKNFIAMVFARLRSIAPTLYKYTIFFFKVDSKMFYFIDMFYKKY